MIEVHLSETFAAWFDGLRDPIARKRIGRRLMLLGDGYFGDVKWLGDKIAELRIDHGPGYRLYFTRRGEELVLLLVGGDKGSQARDIAKAKEMAAALG